MPRENAVDFELRPVCAKAGIWPYPCSGRLELQKDVRMKGSFLCEEHAFQASQPATSSAIKACSDCKGAGVWGGTSPRGVCGQQITGCKTCGGTGEMTRAVAVRRLYGGYEAFGFDCPEGFAPFCTEESAIRCAARYNDGERLWCYWPIAETTLL